MATLTELQKARIRFHLGYQDTLAAQWIEFKSNLLLDNGLTEQQILQVVGTEGSLPRYLFLGQDLCQVGSILHRCEQAYELLNVDTIDASLFVIQADTVTLRGGELQNRYALYYQQIAFLGNVLGIMPHTGSDYPRRVGF